MPSTHMLKSVLLAFTALLLTLGVSQAQTHVPADVGTLPTTTPQEFDIQDKTGTWVPFGAIDPATHTWSMPITGLTGILPAANGGLGAASLSGLLVGNGASAATTIVPGLGVPAALGVDVGVAGSVVINGGALGTPSSGVATHLTGLPLSTGVIGMLPAANGGLGAASLSGLLVGNGASPATAIPPGLGVPSALANALNGPGGLLGYSMLGTSGATIPLNNTNNAESGQWQFGNLIGVTSPGSAALFGNFLTTYPPGELGTGYFQMIAAFTGGAPSIDVATVAGPVQGYQQIQANVTYWEGTGVTGRVDNYSFLAQGIGVFPSCYTWHDGGCWGENAYFYEEPETYAATAGQTAFVVPNKFGQGQTHVSKNGTQLINPTQFTETGCSGSPVVCTTITLAVGAALGDAVVVWRGAPQTPHLGDEIDGYIGPGADTYFNNVSGSRVLVAAACKYVGPAGLVGSCGTGFEAFTTNNASIAHAYGFNGDGGLYAGLNGFDCSNAIFTGNCFYTPGVLSDGENIGIGSGGRYFGIEMAGTSTTMPNGVGLHMMENTGAAIDARYLADHTYSTVDLGSWSNNNVAIWRNSAVAMTFLSTGPQFNVLPASAGGGGLYLCVDSSGQVYKKVSCP